ncbi:MAG: hypothetical protein KIT84_22970 [Labilithrix sp.]|nr:hypothetical protein [Labilithrix sp.]MCW5813908.1 hypothetical protein [Labilithrix sp.]
MSLRPNPPRRRSETAKVLLLTSAALAASVVLAGVLAVAVHALHGVIGDDVIASTD